MPEIKLDTPIEVTYAQLYECMKHSGGIAYQDADCRTDGKFFVKLMSRHWREEIEVILSHPSGLGK